MPHRRVPPQLEEHLLLKIYLLTGQGIMPWDKPQTPQVRIKSLRVLALGYMLQDYAFDHASGEELLPPLAPLDCPDSWGVPLDFMNAGLGPVSAPAINVVYDIACQFSGYFVDGSFLLKVCSHCLHRTRHQLTFLGRQHKMGRVRSR